MKIFNKNKAIFIALTISFSSILVFVLSGYLFSAERSLPRFVDNANLLMEYQGESLNSKLDEISEKHGCDVVIVTVYSLDGKSPTAYADDFFDYNGYGYGSGYDGILFLISTEYRDWAISTHGFGVTAFTDYGIDYIFEDIKSYLGEDEFRDAFDRFIKLSDEFLTQARNGEPYDRNNNYKSNAGFAGLMISLFLGVIVSFIICGRMVSKMKSVRFQPTANSYVRQNSMKLTKSKEMYLYARVSKVRRKSESGSSGSSTHTSSSGRTHGGGSGKF